MIVRQLTAADAAQWRELRLQALQDAPTAFSSSYEDEVSRTTEQIAERIATGGSNTVYFGAFEGDVLIGSVIYNRNTGIKTRHRAMLVAMYTAPEARGKGIGKALVNALIEYTHTQEGLRQIILAVTVGNDIARQMYSNAGFVNWGIDPEHLQWQGKFYDLEWMIYTITP